MYIINKRGPLSTKEWIQATETEPFSADLIDFKHDPLGNHIPRKTNEPLFLGFMHIYAHAKFTTFGFQTTQR